MFLKFFTGFHWVNRSRFLQIVAIAAININYAQPIHSAETTTNTTGSIVSHNPPSLDAARQQARDTLMVRPDMRFVRAAEFIMQNLGSEPTSTTLTLQPEDAQWLVSADGQPLGKLKPFGKFEENFQFVESVAKKVIVPRAGKSIPHKEEINAGLKSFFIKDMMPAMHFINAAWHDESSALPLHEAMKASLFIRYQILGNCGIDDEISARAIAFMAANSALTDESLDHDKAFLAEFLGYENLAYSIAKHLPETDSTAMFILNNSKPIYEIGQRANASPGMWYLAIRLAANNDNEEMVGTLLSSGAAKDPEHYQLSVAPLVPHAADWHQEAALALRVAAMLPLQMSGKEDYEDGELPIPAFVNALDDVRTTATGPLFDQQLLTDIYETTFCFSVECCMDHFINRFGSMEDAREVQKTLGVSDKGTIGEYSRLLESRVVETGGDQAGRDRLEKLLGEMHYLGARMTAKPFTKIYTGYDALSPRLVQTALKQLRHLDGRPDLYNYVWDMFLYKGFRDLATAEELYTARTIPECWLNLEKQLYLSYFRGDKQRLMKLLDNEHLKDSTKAEYITTYLADDTDDYSTGVLNKTIMYLYNENPDSGNVTSWCRKYFENQKQYDQAIKIAEEYAETQKDSDGLTYPYARSSLADVYAQKGDYKKALEIAETVAPSYTGTALRDMSRFNTRMGNYKEGLDWAEKCRERYGSGLGVECFAWWSMGKYDKAAQAIKDYKSPLSISVLRNQLAKYFLAALGDKTSAERNKAIDAINNVGLNRILGDMGFYFREKDRFDIVFEFYRHVDETGWQEFRSPVLCYNALKLDGKTSEALAWLKKRVPENRWPEVGKFAFRESEYELLNGFTPYDDTTTVGVYNWTLRAATVSIDEDAAKLMGNRVRKYFDSHKSDDFQNVAARFLLDTADKSELNNAIKNQDDLCRAACYLGLKARKNGDYRAASEWFQTCILTGREELNEYQKSRIILANWSTKRRSLDIMKTVMDNVEQKFPGM